MAYPAGIHHSADKVVFGFNWPQLPSDRSMQQAAELPLETQTRRVFGL